MILKTDRLLFREFTFDDTDFIIALLNSPGWLKYIGDRNVKTRDQAIAYLENGPIKSFRDNGFGFGMVELRENMEPIGMCGVTKRDSLDHPDIGFAFLPEHTGKGYAFEIAKATFDHALQVWKIPVIQAITVPYNSASIRLLEKIGLHLEKKIRIPNDDEELLLYST